MNLKVHHHKNDVFPLIKGVLLMLPLLFVLFTSLYVTFNQNAKDSYYGEIINDSEFYKPSEYKSINDYYFVNDSSLNMVSISGTHNITFTKIFDYSANVTLPSLLGSDYQYVQVYYTGNGRLMRFVDLQGNGTSLYFSTLNYIHFENFQFSTIDESLFEPYIFIREYNNYSFLNNALPYAMSEFNYIGFGKIDFVSLIGDFFIDVGQFNNVYLKFINTYINYFLFVELVLFVPSVLHFVIHWFENLGKDISSGREKD